MEMNPDDLIKQKLKVFLRIVRIAQQYLGSGSRMLKVLKGEVNQTRLLICE